MALRSPALSDSVARGYLPGLGVSCHDRTRQEGVGFSASQRKERVSHDSETFFFMITELFSPGLFT